MIPTFGQMQILVPRLPSRSVLPWPTSKRWYRSQALANLVLVYPPITNCLVNFLVIICRSSGKISFDSTDGSRRRGKTPDYHGALQIITTWPWLEYHRQNSGGRICLFSLSQCKTYGEQKIRSTKRLLCYDTIVWILIRRIISEQNNQYAVVYHGGDVTWVPQTSITTRCNSTAEEKVKEGAADEISCIVYLG